MNEVSNVIRITAKPWDRNLKFSYVETSSTLPCNTIFPPQDCSVLFPVPPPPPPPTTGVLKVETFQYITVSDGVKNTYTNQDELIQFGSTGILNPATVSYVNLFINGMLQPLIVYKVSEGVLTIDEAPEKGVPITLQFIKIFSYS
ncbi:DUF4183 domain-containing protein [Paenibacillus sp. OSY-SE]|uniref:DUF4183 domain-containing protein n=1 Tax=Paenibacillus sp. OSY-SE TaxID=1196323 RepID=UPI00037926C3